MAYDFKKEAKMFYMPKNKPEIVTVPSMNFLAVSGQGDPNEEGGAYQRAVSVLYALAYTLKMSYKGTRQIDGFYEYVVPPLEGLWWMEGDKYLGTTGLAGQKDKFQWISMIRQPEFVTPDVFEWAKENLRKKNPDIDLSSTRLVTYTEGLCCQVMHIGPYDDEPATIEKLGRFTEESGYICDIGEERRHHEIYLGDPRRTKPERLRTVIRHPVRKA